jgi:hypothetical protein
MMTVKSVLRRHLSTALAPTLGGRSVRTTAKQALANDLLAVSRNNSTYFAACFAAILLVLIGAAAIAVRYLDSPGTIRAIFSVLGISITALTVQLTSLWKQKVSADLLGVLARNVDDDHLDGVLEALLKKL